TRRIPPRRARTSLEAYAGPSSTSRCSTERACISRIATGGGSPFEHVDATPSEAAPNLTLWSKKKTISAVVESAEYGPSIYRPLVQLCVQVVNRANEGIFRRRPRITLVLHRLRYQHGLLASKYVIGRSGPRSFSCRSLAGTCGVAATP